MVVDNAVPNPDAPYQLTTLGSLSLRTRQGGVLTSVSPRRLAILAVLAAHGSEGVGRDRLMLLFWPDSTRSRARNALHQAIHAIRSTLGNDAVHTGTLELRLNSEIVRSDVAELRDRFAAGDFARVRELYRGPFLDGVYIKGAVEFERWADDERRVLADIHSKANAPLQSEGSLPSFETLRGVLPTTPARTIEPLRSRWASKSVRISAVASLGAVITLGMTASSWFSRTKAPDTMAQEMFLERKRLFAERERSTRGRVFIETPIVEARGAVFDTLARGAIQFMHGMIHQDKIAHAVPRDTVIAVERVAAEMMGLNNAAVRFSRANARIGVTTTISRVADSVVVRMYVQRTAPMRSPPPAAPWSAFWRRLRIGTPKVETTRPWVESGLSVVESAPLDKPYRAVAGAAWQVAKALDGMRSCKIEDHLSRKSLPWCWESENEPVLIQGLSEARRKALAAQR